MVCSFFLYFFFFSSRRRHTRLVSDWSSDVCSSDLYEHERVLLRNALEIPPPGRERLRTVGCGVVAKADERLEVAQHPVTVALVHGLLDGLAELSVRIFLLVVLVDAGLRLDDLGQRPEADAGSVGQRPTLPP